MAKFYAPVLLALKTSSVVNADKYTPVNVPRELLENDGRQVSAFSLLAPKKRKLFTIDKPVRTITHDDILTSAEKALGAITYEDYKKFMTSIEGIKTTYNYEDTPLGYMLYLRMILDETGYLALSIIAYENTHANAGLSDTLEAYDGFTGNALELCSTLAEKTYAADKGEVLPLPQMPHKPERYLIPNNRLINKMTDGTEIINTGGIDLKVMGDITTYVMIADPSGLPSGMGAAERGVFNAICSIYRQAESEKLHKIVITPTSVYRAMPGGGDKPGKAMQNFIIATIDKMRHMPITIDATNELRKLKKIGKTDKFVIESQMVHADKGVFTRRNKSQTVGWVLFAMPAVGAYAEKTGQIINIPAKYMQIKETAPNGESVTAVSMSGHRRELLEYIACRVEIIKRAMRNAKDKARKSRNEKRSIEEIMVQDFHTPPVIRYDTMFAAIGIAEDKCAKMDARNFCKLALNYWTREKFIDGYLEQTQKKVKTSIKLLIS